MRILPRVVAAGSLLVACAACNTAAPVGGEHNRTVGMSLREATALVASFEQKQVPPSKKPPPPTTMEEALAVLKSDRLDLFPDSVAWLETQPAPDAVALSAQTMLAWGEAELTVAEVLAETAAKLDENVRALQVRKLVGEENRKLEAERA